MDGAEVLTTAYFDENGELVCEDAVDSDDDLFNGGCDEDPDAQATALTELNDTHQASSMLPSYHRLTAQHTDTESILRRIY